MSSSTIPKALGGSVGEDLRAFDDLLKTNRYRKSVSLLNTHKATGD